MSPIERLETLLGEVNATMIVTSTVRKDWSKQIERVLKELAQAEEDEDDDWVVGDEDDEDDEDVEPSEGTTYLSPKAVHQVAYTLGCARWQVEDDPEESVLNLCEKVRGGR